MTEVQVKEALDFLIKDFNFEYKFQEFKNCPFGNWCTDTCSYYNKHSCFTITMLIARDDIEYICLDNVNLLKDYLFSEYSGKINLNNEELRRYYDEKLRHVVRIYEYEPEIWNRHEKKSLFGSYFWGDKKRLSILAEVIKAQIEKNGEFFGIKV